MGKDGRKDGRDQAESSKEGKRRSKRMRLVEVALTINEKSGGVRISNVESNTPPIIPHNLPLHPHVTTLGHPNNPQHSAFPTNSSNPSHHSSQQEEQLPERNKRGKTMMKSLSLTPSERAEVEFNDKEQPVGSSSVFLSSYVGALAREMIPFNIRSWKKVGDLLKDDLWTCIKTRFKLDDLDKVLLLKMMGARWKESKSRLVSAIRHASLGPQCANKLSMLRPDNIKSDQEWSDFIKEKTSDEFEAERRRKLGLPPDEPALAKPASPVEEKKCSLPIRPATKAERMRDCLRSLKRSHKAFKALLTAATTDEQLSALGELMYQIYQANITL